MHYVKVNTYTAVEMKTGVRRDVFRENNSGFHSELSIEVKGFY